MSLKSLLSNARGAAVVEMALVAPVLALGVIGIVDVSNAYSKKLALEQGAQRAIEKIMNTTVNATVESTLATAAICQVTVTDKYTPLFPIHFSAFNTSDSTYHLSATAGTRTM